MEQGFSARQNSPADSRRVTAPSCRSRVTNGKVLVAGIDGRSRHARRLRDLYHAFLDQTGGRHEVMVRSLSSLVLRREQLDARIAAGGDVNTYELLRADPKTC
jgi:hypothetical protein